MTRPPPRSTRTYHLFPYTTLFLSAGVFQMVQHAAAVDVIPRARRERARIEQRSAQETDVAEAADLRPLARDRLARLGEVEMHPLRSDEHTSELQSLMSISSAVFCLKKNTTLHINKHTTRIQN